MPSRLIRSEILDSDRYWALSNDARLLFFHLMLLADDLGCVSLSPVFLRRRCFAIAPQDQDIARWLLELVDQDMLRTYEVDRKCYGLIPRFRQRVKQWILKHPHPPRSLVEDDSFLLNKLSELSTNWRPLGANSAPEVKRSEVKRSEGEIVDNFSVDNFRSPKDAESQKRAQYAPKDKLKALPGESMQAYLLRLRGGS